MNVQSDISTADAFKYAARRAGARAPGLSGASHLIMAVADSFEVALSDLRSPTRGRRNVALARQSGIYLARTVFGMTLSDAGGLFNRDRTTAAHACRLVEDLRDHPHFDRLLTELEEDLRAAAYGTLQ